MHAQIMIHVLPDAVEIGVWAATLIMHHCSLKPVVIIAVHVLNPPTPFSSLTHSQGFRWHVEEERCFHKRGWLLCRWSLPVSVISVIWLVFAAVIFTLPTIYPITGENFNYAAAVVGGAGLVVTIAWVLSARFWFTGPRIDVDNSDAVKTKYWVTDPPRKVRP